MQAFRFLFASVLLVVLTCVGLSARQRAEQQLVDGLLSCMLDGAGARDDLRAIKLSGIQISDSFATMTANRSAIRRFNRCGATANAITTNSEDIAEARNALTTMANVLVGAFERSLKLDEKLLGVTTEAQLRAVVPEASKIADDIDAAWRLYMPVAGIVAHVLVDSEKPNAKGQLDRLVLTRKQISKMRSELKEWFPGSANTGDKHVVDAAAKLLLEFLGQPWLAADDK